MRPRRSSASFSPAASAPQVDLIEPLILLLLLPDVVSDHGFIPAHGLRPNTHAPRNAALQNSSSRRRTPTRDESHSSTDEPDYLRYATLGRNPDHHVEGAVRPHKTHCQPFRGREASKYLYIYRVSVIGRDIGFCCGGNHHGTGNPGNQVSRLGTSPRLLSHDAAPGQLHHLWYSTGPGDGPPHLVSRWMVFPSRGLALSGSAQARYFSLKRLARYTPTAHRDPDYSLRLMV
jgi:hypothetical protein